MKFAVNFSYEAEALLRQGRIQVDLFKVPNWPDLATEVSRDHPVAIHFNLEAGPGNVQKVDRKQIADLLEQTGTPYVNMHLNPTVASFPDINPEAPTPRQANRVIDQMLRDIAVITERFKGERVILENVPYRGNDGETIRTAVEPENIRRILEETGCGLLLDISHARIAAHQLGIEPHAYLSSLPVERLRELHFTGLHNLNGRLQDHLPVLPADWPVLEWVLQRIRSREWPGVWMLAFEYGGIGDKFEGRRDPAVMVEQIPRLYEMVKSLD